MTEKQIRKAVELAEGFGVWPEYETYVEYKDESFPIKNIQEWEFYPLLLYRAMENLNDSENVWIELLTNFVSYWAINSVTVHSKFHNCYTPTPYLTAKEQALESALKEVL